MAGFAVVVGFVYGWVLKSAAQSCFRDQGSLIPAALSSAPFGFGGLRAALLGTPLFWASMGFLSMRLTETRLRWFFVLLLTCHVGGAVYLVKFTPFGNYGLGDSTEFKLYFGLWALLYALGHAVLLRQLFKYYANRHETV